MKTSLSKFYPLSYLKNRRNNQGQFKTLFINEIEIKI